MKLRRFEASGYAGYNYWCPGCEDWHSVTTESTDGKQRPTWSFNGDLEKPVFSPSVLVTNGHYVNWFKQGDSCWCTYNQEQIAAGEEPSRFKCQICHTFIGCNGAQPGQVIFLGDCTHELAGKVVDFPDLPER